MNTFPDRRAAGRTLAALLEHYSGRPDVLVLGLPRGGVPVAAEVAERLHAPLDVIVVRKLSAPGEPEVAVGAIASGGLMVMNESIKNLLEGSYVLQSEIARERAELRRREALYRNGRLPLDLRGRTVILVDDGAATGACMRAAIVASRQLGAERIVVAVPVASIDALSVLRQECDEVVCAFTPEAFRCVGEWYDDFEQTSDTEVAALLWRAHYLERLRAAPHATAHRVTP
jgi:predicted phosphoribosyltransferase